MFVTTSPSREAPLRSCTDMRMTRILALLAAGALAVPAGAAAQSWHSSILVKLPRKGHGKTFSKRMRVGKDLDGFLMWMQMRGPAGTVGNRIGPQHETILAEPDGHKYASLRLTARYDRRGRLLYSVRVKNLDVTGKLRKK